MLGELSQQLSAKSVNGSALDQLGTRAKMLLEATRDLARGFVRERERADSFRIEVSLLDKESDPLDETERLASAGAGQYQNRPGLSFYCGKLRWGGAMKGVGDFGKD